MASARLDTLKGMVAQNPGDSFARFGLAMEYRGAGELEEAAAAFAALVDANPAYLAAYYHYGRTLRELGRTEDARQAYRQGVETAKQQGNTHALKELEAALEYLG
jgi:tetratricopeptide (TPR) repeat protein